MLARSASPLILLAAFSASCRSTALRNEVATDGTPVRVLVHSGDRRDFLRKPRLQ